MPIWNTSQPLKDDTIDVLLQKLCENISTATTTAAGGIDWADYMAVFGTDAPLKDDTIHALLVKANENILIKYGSINGTIGIWGPTKPRFTDTIQVLLVKLSENVLAFGV